MVEIYQPLQILRHGAPTGKWRMTWRSDESSDGFIGGMCEHEHDSAEEAAACEDARRQMPPELSAAFGGPGGQCECGMMARSGQRFLTLHHPGCSRYDPEGDARAIIEPLVIGINNWACDCDGIPDEMREAVQRARISIGLPPLPDNAT